MENQTYTLKDLEVGSPEWKEYRRSRVSASEVPIVLGFSKYCTPAQLFWKKVNGIDERVDTRHTRRGIAAEPRIVRELQAHNPFVLPNSKLAQSEEYPWLTATLDALSPQFVYEIKCPERPWECPPGLYIWQLKAQLLVVGRTEGFLVEGEESGKIREMWPVHLTRIDRDFITGNTKRFVKAMNAGSLPISLW